MRLKEKFERRHICTWMKSFIHSDDYGCTYDLERKCSDCGRVMQARITRAQKDELPESVLHLGDFSWKDE